MLVYLNGSSSSGKSSIAIELQRLIQRPILYFSIDTILYSLGKEDLLAIMGRQPYRVPMKWDAIFSGYLACVASLIQAGNEVIADCPIHSEKLAKEFDKYIQPLPNKIIVKLDCDLEIVESRELARGDRVVGGARRQFEGIHKYLEYNIEIRSDKGTPNDLAHGILDHIEGSGRK